VKNLSSYILVICRVKVLAKTIIPNGETMFSEKMMPHFSDTDALGHINNTKPPIWFEGARAPIFKFFTPDLDPKKWQLIIAKIEVSYHDQLYYGQTIEIKTYISRIGGASFDVYQELWQHDKKCVSGTAAMVNFDYQAQHSIKIPAEIKVELTKHLYE
jgi:acyl-CoA thioester hydrolase